MAIRARPGVSELLQAVAPYYNVHVYTAGYPRYADRVLDRLVLALEPGHAHHASRYEAAMRARNRLLADEAPLDREWCEALEAQMAEHGMALAEARARTVEARWRHPTWLVLR